MPCTSRLFCGVLWVTLFARACPPREASFFKIAFAAVTAPCIYAAYVSGGPILMLLDIGYPPGAGKISSNMAVPSSNSARPRKVSRPCRVVRSVMKSLFTSSFTRHSSARVVLMAIAAAESRVVTWSLSRNATRKEPGPELSAAASSAHTP